MYRSCAEEAVKDKISYLFTRTSTLHVVIETIALALGVHCSDVRQVVSFCFPRDIKSYIHEPGTAGRDNLPSLVTLIRKPTSGRITMGEHATYIISCRRDVLFLSIDGQELVFHSVSMMCCDLLLNYELCDCN